MLLRSLFAAAGLALAFGPSFVRADDAMPARKKVLFFSKSAGFEHDAIKDVLKEKGKPDRPGYAFAVIKAIGEKENVEFVFSKDGSLFTPEYLAQFDAFWFYTTGDLTEAGTDKNPPMTPAGKEAFLKAIDSGKGFIGTHSATDTFHSKGNADWGQPRYVDDGANADSYIRMIGGEFIKHDAQQPAPQIVIDSAFPGVKAVPADFGPNEEWYSLKDFASNLHVILVQDTTKMKGPSYDRPPYPSTWARMYGKGRVFYTSMGHREDVWTNPAFQSVITGGLNWALHRVEADVTPNLTTAAPKANELPKYTPPPPPKPKAQKKAN